MSERFGRRTGTPWQRGIERNFRKLSERANLRFYRVEYQVALLQAGYTHVDSLLTLRLALDIAQRLEDLGHTGFVEQVEGMIRAKEEETARSGQEVDDFNRDMARIDVLLESLKARTKGLATPEEFQGALADYAAAGAKKK